MERHKPNQPAARVLERQIPAHLRRELKLQLANLPTRYFQSLDLPNVTEDLTLTERLPSERIIVTTTEHDGRLTLRVLMAKNEPRIFLRVAAMLARHKISVDRASIFTGVADGMVLDHFVLSEPVDRRALELMMFEVRNALVTRRFIAPRLDPPNTHGLRISVVNLPNSDHTTVALYARDQIGFLYRIAQVFSKLELELRYAKIQTLKNQIIDTFHVLNRDGTVLTAQQQQVLCEALALAFAVAGGKLPLTLPTPARG